jgi:hypothetical protein
MIDEELESMNIGFLRGHVAQLTREEIKKKGWWPFWR